MCVCKTREPQLPVHGADVTSGAVDFHGGPRTQLVVPGPYPAIGDRSGKGRRPRCKWALTSEATVLGFVQRLALLICLFVYDGCYYIAHFGLQQVALRDLHG